MEDEVVTGGFLLPRKISARKLRERSQGIWRIRSSPSPWELALACAGLTLWEQQLQVLRESPARNLGAMDQGLLGAEC